MENEEKKEISWKKENKFYWSNIQTNNVIIENLLYNQKILKNERTKEYSIKNQLKIKIIFY